MESGKVEHMCVVDTSSGALEAVKEMLLDKLRQCMAASKREGDHQGDNELFLFPRLDHRKPFENIRGAMLELDQKVLNMDTQ